MDQFLSIIDFLVSSDQLSIYLTVWTLLAVALTIALLFRRIIMHMAALEEMKRRDQDEERLDDEKVNAERAEAEVALEKLQANAATKVSQRTARDFTPYGYSDHAA
jgi:cytochrome c biogenesis protein ResB